MKHNTLELLSFLGIFVFFLWPVPVQLFVCRIFTGEWMLWLSPYILGGWFVVIFVLLILDYIKRRSF